MAMVAAGVLATLLGGCVGQTTVDQAGSVGTYNVAFSMDPARLNPPQHGSVNYSVTDAKTNKPVITMDTIYGAEMHYVTISRDMSQFQHTWATESQRAQFSMPIVFQIQSLYYSYALFQPTGSPQQVLTGTVQAGQEGPAPDLTPDSDRPKESYGSQYQLILGTNPIRAGTPAQLAVFVTERGAPVNELWPFLGAPGYLWIVDQNGDNFAVETGASESRPFVGTGTPTPQLTPGPTFAPDLIDPLATATAFVAPTLLPVQQTPQVSVVQTPNAVTPSIAYGPTVAFTHTFPTPGLYKVWAEIEYRAQVSTVSWVINVTP
jgi:hypothetical protein